MSVKKPAGIVPLTQEAKMWTAGIIEVCVREDLRVAMGQTMDLNAHFGAGIGDTPLGILNKVCVGSYPAGSTKPLAPIIAEIDRMASKLILHMTLAKIGQAPSWRWPMNDHMHHGLWTIWQELPVVSAPRPPDCSSCDRLTVIRVGAPRALPFLTGATAYSIRAELQKRSVVS